METADPHAALSDKSVAVRAAAARDLARHGSWEDVARLVEVAWGERKATSVRLYAAAAAADIACRARGAWGQALLTPEQRDQCVRWAFGGDPGNNPSMLMLAAAGDPAAVLPRMGRIVRDPRGDVRLGAVTAVRRMVLSAVGEPDRVAELVGEWLQDPRVPTDTRTELVKLVGEAGLAGLRRVVNALEARTPALAEVREVALDRLDARQRPATWRGLWVSDGLDVYELAVAPRADDLAVWGPTGFHGPEGTAAAAVEAGGARIGDRPARLVWAHRLGSTEPAVALLVDGRVWWRADGAALPDLLADRWSELASRGLEAREVAHEVAFSLDGQVAPRAQAITAWLLGRFDEALAVLEGPLSRKRPRTDLYWWRARVLADLGRAEEARSDLDAFLERTKRDAPHHAEAEALRASLDAGR